MIKSKKAILSTLLVTGMIFGTTSTAFAYCGGGGGWHHGGGYGYYNGYSNQNYRMPYTQNYNDSTPSVNSAYDENVFIIQSTLNDLGYDVGEADGIYGNQTKKALKTFQKDYQLTVTGKINKETVEALGL